MVRWIGAVAFAALAVGCVASVSCVRVGGSDRRAALEREAALPKRIVEPKDGSTMLLVPSGEFIMGDPESRRRVTLPAFYIDHLEVSNALYSKFLAAVKEKGDAAWRHPDQPPSKRDHTPAYWYDKNLGIAKADLPVVGVDWFNAYAYAKWAGKRLPTEAEWERAARGTDGRLYPWGNTPPADGLVYRANYFPTYHAADGHQYTAPVESFEVGASPVGCLNMAGNVSEWCSDWFAPAARGSQVSPEGPPTGTRRIVRGASWNTAEASLRCYNRWPMPPAERDAGVGFRCVKDAFPAAAPAPPKAGK